MRRKRMMPTFHLKHKKSTKKRVYKYKTHPGRKLSIKKYHKHAKKHW